MSICNKVRCGAAAVTRRAVKTINIELEIFKVKSWWRMDLLNLLTMKKGTGCKKKIKDLSQFWEKTKWRDSLTLSFFPHFFEPVGPIQQDWLYSLLYSWLYLLNTGNNDRNVCDDYFMCVTKNKRWQNRKITLRQGKREKLRES